MSTEKTMDHADTCGPATAKHTPGPWYADGGNIYIDTREQVCCGRSGDECCGVPDVRGDFDLIAECGVHNARLISAAPDLVEALKHLLDALEGPSRTSLEDIEIAICAGRAALSKALGTPVSGESDGR